MIRATKKEAIERKWHLIDAKGQVLGRLASRIAPLLMGKNKACFVRNLDCGDHIVVVNAKEVILTGKKETQKVYQSFSGYPSGLREVPAFRMRETFPERMVERAVANMLPKNKLRALWLKKLHVFAGPEHQYQDKFMVKKEK
ncbi:MAG TPA: 50S ribosomal protein L13 [Patescibacteria group bacterium]|nr:50S ribosomal protein L13 [Patescibacteria group bacterium]